MSEVNPTQFKMLHLERYLTLVPTQLMQGCNNHAVLLPYVWHKQHPNAAGEYRQDERRDEVERPQHLHEDRPRLRPGTMDRKPEQ